MENIGRHLCPSHIFQNTFFNFHTFFFGEFLSACFKNKAWIEDVHIATSDLTIGFFVILKFIIEFFGDNFPVFFAVNLLNEEQYKSIFKNGPILWILFIVNVYPESQSTQTISTLSRRPARKIIWNMNPIYEIGFSVYLSNINCFHKDVVFLLTPWFWRFVFVQIKIG